jgi:rhodanese-related sulfurtransferase
MSIGWSEGPQGPLRIKVRRPGRALLLLVALAPAAAGAADTSDDVFDLQDLRVKITESIPWIETRHNGGKVLIMRYQDPAHTIEAPYQKTARACPPFCVQPMRLAPGVETIGELGLLEYLRRIGQGDEDVLVIDARTHDWTARGTIPGSISIPYTRIDPAHASPQAVADLLQLEFGAIRADSLWNFSAVKTLVFFCNGSWCGQSPTMIKALLALGYPADKLKWYRGGMQSWESLGFTTVKPEPAQH